MPNVIKVVTVLVIELTTHSSKLLNRDVLFTSAGVSKYGKRTNGGKPPTGLDFEKMFNKHPEVSFPYSQTNFTGVTGLCIMAASDFIRCAVFDTIGQVVLQTES